MQFYHFTDLYAALQQARHSTAKANRASTSRTRIAPHILYPNMATKPQKTNPAQQNAPQSPLDKALIKLGEDIFKRDSKNRFAEDRQWFASALFYQLKQWLRSNASGVPQPIEQDKNKPVPMPVTDHFSKTINANSNTLGAAIPEMSCVADDASARNRRAAEAAENSFDEMDKESGMDVLNPILAKHTVLWGLGVTKDCVDTSASTGMDQVPQLTLDENGEPQLTGTQTFPKGKLLTEVVPIMEIYLPRDCRDPNLAKRILHRYPKNINTAKALYPEFADQLKAEEKRDLPQVYMEALRSLVMGSLDGGENVILSEIWIDYDELTDEVKQAITEEWGNQPSQVLGYEGLTREQAAKQHGIYFIWTSGNVIAKGENPWDGKKCFTFFPWEKDPASPYSKGLAVTLATLQKRLNRCDSMIELAMMTNSVGKWIIPTTQVATVKGLGGTANEVIWWDPQGDGKTAPTFAQPSPVHPIVVQYREGIIADFEALGYTEGVGTGDAPSGVKSFRGIAYLGAKQEENIATQRFLWEQAHEIRKQKLLIMAKKVWDNPRKAKVAGYNGKFGIQELTGEDLTGDFGVEVIKDSSKPKTRSEKLQSIQIAAQGGLIDPTESTTREYVLDALNLTDVQPADHLNYVKADRDLERLKQGLLPKFESPYTKWDIPFKLFAQYTLTEEFEELDPQIQKSILLYTQYISDKLAAINNPQPSPMQMAGTLAAAIGGGNQSPLQGLPGVTAQPGQVEKGAAAQGAALASAAGAGAPATSSPA